jgi:hypothetical protein
MFVPFWLFIVLSGFGCYGALVFINAIRTRKSKVVSPSASHNKTMLKFLRELENCAMELRCVPNSAAIRVSKRLDAVVAELQQ